LDDSGFAGDGGADVGGAGVGGAGVGGAGVGGAGLGGAAVGAGNTEKLILRVKTAVEDGVETCTESEDCPVCVGVPEITPVEAARLRPRGSWPEANFQAYGLMPPWASKAAEYGAWTTAAGIL
jgi:hypothetical protein